MRSAAPLLALWKLRKWATAVLFLLIDSDIAISDPATCIKLSHFCICRTSAFKFQNSLVQIKIKI